MLAPFAAFVRLVVPLAGEAYRWVPLPYGQRVDLWDMGPRCRWQLAALAYASGLRAGVAFRLALPGATIDDVVREIAANVGASARFFNGLGFVMLRPGRGGALMAPGFGAVINTAADGGAR